MAWTEIETVTLASPAASIVFNTGLGGYKFYRVSLSMLSDASSGNITLRLNSDTGNNYSYQRVTATTTSVSGAHSTGVTEWFVFAGAPLANASASASILIAKPSASLRAQGVHMGGTNAAPNLFLHGSEWNNTTDSLTSISILKSLGNFAVGTSILLEGLAT